MKAAVKYSVAGALAVLFCTGMFFLYRNVRQEQAQLVCGLLMPILAIVCGAMGDKLEAIGGTPTVLIGVAIAASSAMILPISTPPNALAFSTNLVQQKDMSKIGIIVGVISMVLGFGLVYMMGVLKLI